MLIDALTCLGVTNQRYVESMACALAAGGVALKRTNAVGVPTSAPPQASPKSSNVLISTSAANADVGSTTSTIMPAPKDSDVPSSTLTNSTLGKRSCEDSVDDSTANSSDGGRYALRSRSRPTN